MWGLHLRSIGGKIMANNRLIDSFRYDMKLINKFNLSFLFVAFIPLVLLSIIATYICGIYIEKAEKQNQFNQLKTINNMIDFNYEIYINKAEQIFSNEELQVILSEDYDHFVDLVEAYIYINKYFEKIIFDLNYTMYEHTESRYEYDEIKIKIFSYNNTLKPDDRYILDIKEVENEAWFKKAIESDSITWGIFRDIGGKSNIRISRKMVNFKELECMGILSIEIPMDLIEYMINKNKSNKEESFFYVDNTGKILIDGSQSNEDIRLLINDYYITSFGEMETVKLDGKDYVIYGVKSQITDWSLISLLPLKYIKESSKELKKYTLLVAFFVLILCFITAHSLSNIIKKRLNLLINKIEKIQKDYYSDLTIIGGKDEIGQVDKVLNSMINEIKNLIDVEYKSRILKDSIKLDLLQEQINPHLLYNTLSTIGWHAKKSCNEKLSDITNSLIRFYRISLNRGQVFIPLKQEVEMTLEYIELIEFTYNMDFEKDIDISPQIEDYYTIKLILQPIVENALLHGLYQSNIKGKLELSCYKIDDNIRIRIADNGMGMDENMIQSLMNDVAVKDKGYGLTNVIKRLRLYYGENQHIQIKSSKDKGTEVTIEIPVMNEVEFKDYLEKKYLL